MWHKRPNTLLVEVGDSEFWDNIWHSQVFKDCIKQEGPYKDLIEKAQEQPWWFVDAEQNYEHRHFSIWFGQTFLRRQYSNPVITDLYYFHDLVHAMTFRRMDDENLTEQDWRLAMRANEIAVSIETEMLMYWRFPELRQHTFAEKIWADDITSPTPEYLQKRVDNYRMRYALDADFAEKEGALRRAVLKDWPLKHPELATAQGRDFDWFWDLRRETTLNPDPENPVEVALRKYEDQAQPFYNKWVNDWRDVEKERAKFADLCASGNWLEAVRNRHKCWESNADKNGVPYGDLAPRPKKLPNRGIKLK